MSIDPPLPYTVTFVSAAPLSINAVFAVFSAPPLKFRYDLQSLRVALDLVTSESVEAVSSPAFRFTTLVNSFVRSLSRTALDVSDGLFVPESVSTAMPPGSAPWSAPH